MIHAREDYNRIQDPAGKIGIDEPVFLVRAKDKLAPNTVRQWALLCKEAGNEPMGRIAAEWANKMEEWQDKNGCKNPDMPTERILDAPSKYPLEAVLKELKFGRPAAGQIFLDRCLEMLAKEETLGHE